MQHSEITNGVSAIDPTWVGTINERRSYGIVDTQSVPARDDALATGDRILVHTGSRERSATVAYTYADGATVGIRFDGGAHVNVYPSSAVRRVS